MKATEITLQLVKNIGNYETCRFQATYQLTDDDDISESFITAKFDLEQAFKDAFKDDLTTKTPKVVKELIDEGSSEFVRICKALNDKRTDIIELQRNYIFSAKALTYLQQNKLL
jgi:hypothetical protein